jgi:transcriptional regulator with XRE-family HTH domain
MNLKEKVGLNLKSLREAKGLSLRALSELSGGLYSASRLGNYEQGTRMLPLDCANNIAGALGCSASDILMTNPKTAKMMSELSDDQLRLFEAILDAPEELQAGIRRLLNVEEPE